MAWLAQIGACVFPGSPACNADEEYSDGRVIRVLYPEYYTMNSSGVCTQLTVAGSGCNAYSSANALDIRAHSDFQYVMVSSDHPNAIAMLGNSTKEQDCIDVLVAFVVAESFTGVVLDWEEFSSYTHAEYLEFLAFTEDLAVQLQAVGKKLILCGPPIGNSLMQSYYADGWHYSDFESHSVNQVFVMSYDYQFDYGSGESMAPDAWTTDNIEWTQSEISDDERIIIGLVSSAYYGTTGAYNPVNKLFDQMSGYPGYGSATRNADSEMVFSGAGSSGVYQDTTSMNQQRTMIEALGVKHIAVWVLGGHNPWFTGTEPDLPGGGGGSGRIAISAGRTPCSPRTGCTRSLASARSHV